MTASTEPGPVYRDIRHYLGELDPAKLAILAEAATARSANHKSPL
jgi:hypothetical protein